MDLFTFSWQILVILFLVFLNSFFVASEFAIVKIRSTQLKPLLKTGNWRVKLALNVTKHLDAYLSATQLGITLASIGLGFAGEPFLGYWFEKLFHSFGWNNELLISTLSFGFAFGIVTFLHIVVGELAPKSLAIQKPKAVTLWCAPILTAFYYLFLPFIWLLNGTANWMLKGIGIEPASEAEHGFSTDELQFVLMHAQHVHPTDELINTLMLKTVRMRQTTAEQVMMLPEKIVCLWKDKSLEENLEIAQRVGYSRLPFCDGSLNNVLGVIHVKEMLWQERFLKEQTNLENILHPILSFTRNTKLPTMLELFRTSRNHLALVIDENNQTLGIVSFEDVLEEIVGDIKDEFDIQQGPFYEVNENSVLVDGDLSLRDLNIETGWQLQGEKSDTVATWAIRKWGGHPGRGEKFQENGILIEAVDVSARSIRKIKLSLEKEVSDN